MIKEKLIEAIHKLKNIIIITSIIYVFYNMYLIKKVYFRCKIVKLILQQENILIKISKTVLFVKLGLSKKFPRKMLYTRKSTLGISLIRSSTILAILTLKLYLGHKRSKD